MQTLKDMYRTDWSRITKRRYITKTLEGNGVVALIKIDDIKEPLYVKNSSGDKVLIVEKGYSWVELAFKDTMWFLTAMFNDRHEFIQLYFDINKGNDFSDMHNIKFVDMYLDIVVDTNGEIILMDEDELLEAYHNNDIDEVTYLDTIRVTKDLYEELKSNKDYYITLMTKLCRELNEEL